MNPRTAVSVVPAGRRVNFVGLNDNLLRSRGSSEGDMGEGQGQESDEGQTGHGGGKRQNRVAIWGRILCSRVQYMRFQVMRKGFHSMFSPWKRANELPQSPARCAIQ